MDLDHRFVQLFLSIAPEARMSDILSVRNDLLRSFNDRWRHYHTLDHHIYDFISKFDEIKHFLDDPVSFEIAAFYHDIVYVPGGLYNEEASADRVLFDCARLGYKDGEKIRELIMGEKTGTRSKDLDFFIDIDYSILGVSAGSYRMYMDSIYDEYVLVPGFKKGRGDFLSRLLDRGRIYRTDYYRDRYEKRALNNIKKELMYGKDFPV